jgi:hypothetical protein
MAAPVTWDLGPAERRAHLAALLADDIANDSTIRDALTGRGTPSMKSAVRRKNGSRKDARLRADITGVADILARFLAAELIGQPDAWVPQLSIGLAGEFVG